MLIGSAAFIAYGLSGGCFAQRLPPRLSDAQAAILAAGPLPYRVVVAPWDSAGAARRRQNPRAYAEKTFRWLESSGAFTSVRMGTVGDTAADFIASPTGAYCNTAVIPIFTAVSLGLIPTIFKDTDCEGAVLYPLHPLHPPGGEPDSIVVRSRLSGRVVMGWLAVPIGALPGWTHGEARGHERYRQQVRLSILTHRSRITALAGAQ
jgi:hypothetical protein